jgi:hypothetical protein
MNDLWDAIRERWNLWGADPSLGGHLSDAEKRAKRAGYKIQNALVATILYIVVAILLGWWGLYNAFAWWSRWGGWIPLSQFILALWHVGYGVGWTVAITAAIDVAIPDQWFRTPVLTVDTAKRGMRLLLIFFFFPVVLIVGTMWVPLHRSPTVVALFYTGILFFVMVDATELKGWPYRLVRRIGVALTIYAIVESTYLMVLQRWGTQVMAADGDRAADERWVEKYQLGDYTFTFHTDGASNFLTLLFNRWERTKLSFSGPAPVYTPVLYPAATTPAPQPAAPVNNQVAAPIPPDPPKKSKRGNGGNGSAAQPAPQPVPTIVEVQQDPILTEQKHQDITTLTNNSDCLTYKKDSEAYRNAGCK